MPACSNRSQARYMPTTIISPWAKLTTRMTPKITDRPSAISPYTMPVSRPMIVAWMTSVSMLVSYLPPEGEGGSAKLTDGGCLNGIVSVFDIPHPPFGHLPPPGKAGTLTPLLGAPAGHREDRLGDGELGRQHDGRLVVEVLNSSRLDAGVLALLVEL